MANTLNLGNGDWATKENSLLGYNSENGNYKPLPFDFTRASNGTFVNKSGLIETAANGVPRIDFLGNTSGALKLEPQRTNLITYSSDFSNAYWIKSGASVVSGFSSPDGGLNAFKLVEGVGGTFHFTQTTPLTLSSGATVTHSIYAKKGERDWLVIGDSNVSNQYCWFDLLNGVVGSKQSGVLSYSIEFLSNGFYRCTATYVLPSTVSRPIFLTSTGDGINSYAGDGTSGLYIYGAQLELGSYATSLINTQGSAVTRVTDSCSQTVPSGIIGQTEGTVYIDFKFIAADGVKVLFTLDGSANNKRIEFWMNEAVLNGFIGGSVNIQIGNTTITEGRYKAAIAYDELGNQAFYVNGTQIGVSSTPYTIANLDNLRFNGWLGGSIYKTSIKTNEVKLYNTRLSNSELAALTSL